MSAAQSAEIAAPVMQLARPSSDDGAVFETMRAIRAGLKVAGAVRAAGQRTD